MPTNFLPSLSAAAPVVAVPQNGSRKAAGPKHRTFIYVNNRLEGNAISTIAAMIQPA
jgi:hypothetical protein